jgi:16S rRNA (guanine966-N2)-methyltransferase
MASPGRIVELASSSRSQSAAKPASSVRIIGGRWKRTPLPVASLPGLRPTPGRVRETVFNWLNHRFGGTLAGLRVLDLFAGSGAMGFEAASRGAASVVMAEQNAAAAAALNAIKARLGAEMVEVVRGDAMATASFYVRSGRSFDLIFIDPPYRLGWLERTLPLVRELLNSGGLAYVESEAPLDKAAMAAIGLEILRADKAGQVFYHLLRLLRLDDQAAPASRADN